MGIYDRDYERSGGWNGGGGYGEGGGFQLRMPTSANGRLLVTLGVVYLAQILFPVVTDWLALPSDWLTAQPWRAYGLVTYSLLHSEQNLSHLLFNVLALFIFGRSIEEKFGGREYLAFFFTAAIVGGLAWSVTELANGDVRSVLLGASGGIAGVVLLFALLNPNAQIYLMGILPVPASLMAVLFVAQDVYGALQRSGNVAYTAHLGGALFGYLYFRNRWQVSDWFPDWLWGAGEIPDFGKLLKRRPNLKIHREADDEPTDDPADDRVDDILRKIQTHGQDSLSRDERRVLEQASRRYQNRPR